MKRTFVQLGPNGEVIGETTAENAHEIIGLLDWMLALRNKGYIGPFPLKLMLEKIRKENNYETEQ